MNPASLRASRVGGVRPGTPLGSKELRWGQTLFSVFVRNSVGVKPSNLPGHSEEKCSSSRQAWRNYSISAIINSTIAGDGVFGRFVGRIAVHSETEVRSLCSKIDFKADRETSPLFQRAVRNELKIHSADVRLRGVRRNYW